MRKQSHLGTFRIERNITYSNMHTAPLAKLHHKIYGPLLFEARQHGVLLLRWRSSFGFLVELATRAALTSAEPRVAVFPFATTAIFATFLNERRVLARARSHQTTARQRPLCHSPFLEAAAAAPTLLAVAAVAGAARTARVTILVIVFSAFIVIFVKE
jgi:hypothetical protein